RDGDIALAGADDCGSSLDPVQHEVRIADHQDLVLGARGLAFDSVGDNDGSTAAGDAAELRRARESRAAAAGEAARLDHPKHLGGAPRDRWQKAVASEVLGETQGAVTVQAAIADRPSPRVSHPPR